MTETEQIIRTFMRQYRIDHCAELRQSDRGYLIDGTSTLGFPIFDVEIKEGETPEFIRLQVKYAAGTAT